MVDGKILSDYVGIYGSGENSEVTITGGTVTGASYGVYIYQNTKVNIGDETEPVSTMSPVITGQKYSGVKKGGGSWNFYNGIVMGKEKAYDGEPTNVREDNSILYGTVTDNDTTYNTAYFKVDETDPWLPTGTYTAGQEVTFGGEQFFVVADDGNSVRLLAKYCLSKTEDAQLTKDATTSDYGITFSSTNYWSSDFTRSPFDLQGDYLANHPLSAAENASNNAIIKAQEYGTAKGVTGRLMTMEEASAMLSSNNEAMRGKWTDGTQPTQGILDWWLGLASTSSRVWVIYGINGLNEYNYDNHSTGVRPVLVVPKDPWPSTDETRPWKPEGATQVDGTDLSTGLSVSKGDTEWTWVVVPKSVTASAEDDTAIESALRSYCSANGVTRYPDDLDIWYAQDGSSIITEKSTELTDAQKALTNGCGLTYSQYQEKRSAMLNSIKNNGGFWIGKYEVGYTGDSLRTTKNGMKNGKANNPTDQTPVIKQNAYPYNFVTCSQAEKLAETLSKSVATKPHTGSLLFGIQWDLTCVYLKLNAEVNLTNSSSWGNYLDTYFGSITGEAKGTSDPTTGGWTKITSKLSNRAWLFTTGAVESRTSILNIVDLAGNIYEYTLERSSAGSQRF